MRKAMALLFVFALTGCATHSTTVAKRPLEIKRIAIPRVNAGAKLFVKGAEDNIYSEDIYYGVDARKGKEWAIVPDARFAYRSFDLVMTNIDDVRSAFSTGVLEISERLSEQIYRSIKN